MHACTTFGMYARVQKPLRAAYTGYIQLSTCKDKQQANIYITVRLHFSDIMNTTLFVFTEHVRRNLDLLNSPTIIRPKSCK